MSKISLKKGNSEKISLKKVAPLLRRVRMEFSWKSNVKLDLDASALLCRHNSQGYPEVISPKHLVFYAATNSFDPTRSVFYGGDVRDGTGDLETIDVNLETVGADVQEIAFVLTIDDPTGKQTFGHAQEGMFKMINDETGEELLNFDFLEDEHKSRNIIHVVSLKRNDSGWDIEGYGVGKNGDILKAFTLFGAQEDWFE